MASSSVSMKAADNAGMVFMVWQQRTCSMATFHAEAWLEADTMDPLNLDAFESTDDLRRWRNAWTPQRTLI